MKEDFKVDCGCPVTMETEEGPQSFINVPNLWVEQLLDRDYLCSRKKTKHARTIFRHFFLTWKLNLLQ